MSLLVLGDCEFLFTLKKVKRKQKSWILGYLGTHLLVSSSCWIFLCSSRLLALHADILQSDRRIGWSVRRVVEKKGITKQCVSLSHHLILVPLSANIRLNAWVLSPTRCLFQRLHPDLCCLSFFILVTMSHSPLWPLWLRWIITDNDALLIRSACIWLNYQQMLTPPSADNLTPSQNFWWAEAADLKTWWDVNSTLFDIYNTRSISNDFFV